VPLARTRLSPPRACAHTHPQLFPGPEAFKFDRFLGESGAALAKAHVMPFGGGVSRCPGRAFATREVKAFVALCLQRYDWLLPDELMASALARKIPAFDASRSGLGIYPPAVDFDVLVRSRT